MKSEGPEARLHRGRMRRWPASQRAVGALLLCLVPWFVQVAVSSDASSQRSGTGAERFVVVCSRGDLDDALRALLEAHFPGRQTHFEVARAHPFDGALYRLVPPASIGGGRNWFRLEREGKHPASYLLPVDVFWQDTVWVAARPLPAGTVLKPSDVLRAFARHTFGETDFVFQEGPVGMRLKQGVGEGQVLALSLLEPPPVIERGAIVRLFYASGSLLVSTRAEALEEGRVGETIRVRPLDSRRACRGIVRGPGDVEVLVP